jgi:2-methylaconitate cis-trans-isomerase PrpF
MSPQFQIAYPDGSPCPTAVIDFRGCPDDESSRLHVVLSTWRRLNSAGCKATKFALIRPSSHPLYDLEFHFAQTNAPVSSDHLEVDWGGNCGHAVLAGVAVATKWHLLPAPTPGSKTRVEVLNNCGVVVAEATCCMSHRTCYRVHFPLDRTKRAKDLLTTGEVQTAIAGAQATLVSAGNDYVFVDARDLGLDSPRQLFDAGDNLYFRLECIRLAAAKYLGLQSFVFPKICCIGAYDGVLAARAISVPKFHPTIALTGLVAIAAAAVVPDTIVNKCVVEAGSDPARLKITTANATISVSSATRSIGADTCIDCVSVPNKRVYFDEQVSDKRRCTAT